MKGTFLCFCFHTPAVGSDVNSSKAKHVCYMHIKLWYFVNIYLHFGRHSIRLHYIKIFTVLIRTKIDWQCVTLFGNYLSRYCQFLLQTYFQTPYFLILDMFWSHSSFKWYYNTISYTINWSRLMAKTWTMVIRRYFLDAIAILQDHSAMATNNS